MFDPKLNADFRFNQPVDQPQSAIGVLGSLFQTLAPDKPKEATQSEKSAMLWGQYKDSLPAAYLDPNNPNYGVNLRSAYRKGVSMNPLMADAADAELKAAGVTPEVDLGTATYDARQKQTIAFAETPQGAIAYSKAQSAAIVDGVFNQDKFDQVFKQEEASYLSTQAAIAKINETKDVAQSTSIVGQAYWDQGKVFAQSYVDAQLNAFSDLMLDIEDGSAEITSEMAAVLGLPEGPITTSNVNALMVKYRSILVNNIRNGTMGQLAASGADTTILQQVPPSKAWTDEVLAPIDELIKVTKDQSGNWGTVLDNMKNKDVLSAYSYIKKNNPDLFARIQVAELLPQEVRVGIVNMFQETSQDWLDFATKLQLGFTADQTQEEVTGSVNDMSKTEAQDATKVSAGTLSQTVGGINAKNAVTTLFAGMTKIDPTGYLSSADFSQIMKSAKGIASEASADPKFKAYLSDQLLSDVNKNYVDVSKNIASNPGFTLVMEPNGSFTIDVDPNAFKRKSPYTGEEYIDYDAFEIAKGLIDGYNNSDEFKAFQAKMSGLGQLGSIGNEITDAFFKTQKVIKREDIDKTMQSSSGSSSSGSTGSIDFAKFESDYGLPAGYLGRVSQIESNGKSDAVSVTGATGLFQFTKGTAKDYGLKDRTDPLASTDAAARLARDNAQYLFNSLGRMPTAAEIYLAHQQGAAGAAKLLSNPDALAVDVVGKQAVEVNGGNASMTAGEFASLWINKYNKTKGGSVSAPSGSTVTPQMSVSQNTPEGTVERPTASSSGVQGQSASASTPEQTASRNASPEAQQAIVQQAKDILASRPLDADVKALIEALVGGR